MTGALVVVPVLNEAAHLPELIPQLLADPATARLVVADGGSVDGSQAIVRDWTKRDGRVVLLANAARIQSAGVNRAVVAQGSGHEWLVRVDAHALYPDLYVSTLLAAAAREGADAVVVPMRTVGVGCFGRAVAVASNSRLGTGGAAHRLGGAGCWIDHGHHALIRLSLYRTIGGYCEAMAANEDAELDVRLDQAGGRLWLEPACAIDYAPRETLGALARQYWRYGAGRADTVRRHGLRPKARQLAPLAPPLAAALAALTPVSRWCAVPLATWAGGTVVAGAAIGGRSGGGCGLGAGVAAAIMHLSWGAGFLARIIGGPPPALRAGARDD